MAEAAEIVGQLAEKLVELGGNRIPPPVVFTGPKGQININAFFVSFERYCLAKYQKDNLSWLQVLPTFLEGEARAIVQAFGYEAEYAVVKQRLVEEFSRQRTLGSNTISEFFAATRRSDESLTCYSIRLQTLAARVASAEEGSRVEMVKSKLCSSLPDSIMQQVNVQLGHLGDVSLSQVVRLACVLESQLLKARDRAAVVGMSVEKPQVWEKRGGAGPRTVVCGFCEKVGHDEANCYLKKNACYRCGEAGHFARECPSGGKKNAKRDGCEFCGKGPHSLAACDLFLRRCMACSWCGELSHPSHECPKKAGSGN